MTISIKINNQKVYKPAEIFSRVTYSDYKSIRLYSIHQLGLCGFCFRACSIWINEPMTKKLFSQRKINNQNEGEQTKKLEWNQFYSCVV